MSTLWRRKFDWLKIKTFLYPPKQDRRRKGEWIAKIVILSHPFLLDSTFIYRPILIKICMNANIWRHNFFIKIIYHLKCHFYIMEKFSDFFTLGPSRLITIFTYVLIRNFCPCFTFIITVCIFYKAFFCKRNHYLPRLFNQQTL